MVSFIKYSHLWVNAKIINPYPYIFITIMGQINCTENYKYVELYELLKFKLGVLKSYNIK